MMTVVRQVGPAVARYAGRTLIAAVSVLIAVFLAIECPPGGAAGSAAVQASGRPSVDAWGDIPDHLPGHASGSGSDRLPGHPSRQAYGPVTDAWPVVRSPVTPVSAAAGRQLADGRTGAALPIAQAIGNGLAASGGAEAGPGARTVTAAESGADTGTDTGTGTSTSTSTSTEISAESDTGTGAETGMQTGAETDSGFFGHSHAGPEQGRLVHARRGPAAMPTPHGRPGNRSGGHAGIRGPNITAVPAGLTGPSDGLGSRSGQLAVIFLQVFRC
jgi:hypothetical protein